MSSPQPTTKNPVAPQRLAEAGVWIARLHGDNRDRALEDGLRRWLQEDPENARAFELSTEVWNEAENLRQFAPLRPAASRRSAGSWGGLFAATAVAMLLIVVGVFGYLNQGVIATAVGEQRQVVLEDGTRVFLNTNTRIVVQYAKEARRVELRRGEALFNVAKKSDWPFIVVAGDRQVQALGTSFVVRREAQRVAVTLVEGSVRVAPVVSPNTSTAADVPAAVSTSTGSATEPSSQQAAPARPSDDVFTLTPGQRLTFGAGATATLDTPSVEKAIAWRRGQVILDDTPLHAAAEEMNRYNATKLIVADEAAAALLVSGLFQAGDSIHFANAVAHAYDLNVEQRADEIILSSSAPR